jgi:hypothetical protein
MAGAGGTSSALASALPCSIYLRPVSLDCEVDLWVEVLVYECPYTTKEVLMIVRWRPPTLSPFGWCLS